MQKDPVRGMTADETKPKLASGHECRPLHFRPATCTSAFDKDTHGDGYPK